MTNMAKKTENAKNHRKHQQKQKPKKTYNSQLTFAHFFCSSAQSRSETKPVVSQGPSWHPSATAAADADGGSSWVYGFGWSVLVGQKPRLRLAGSFFGGMKESLFWPSSGCLFYRLSGSSLEYRYSFFLRFSCCCGLWDTLWNILKPSASSIFKHFNSPRSNPGGALGKAKSVAKGWKNLSGKQKRWNQQKIMKTSEP